jgi:hypothetical protein
MNSRFVATWMRAVAVIAGIVAVVACGGGGSVGSGGTGITIGTAQGTVSGFGSIFLDGERFDDQNVEAVDEDPSGRDVAAEVDLGHRVELQFDTGNVVSALRLDGALLGTVSSIDAAQGTFVVLGQTVRVNTNADQGPLTQFGGGYTGLADVKANDSVDVHGIVVGSAIQATRVQKLATLPFLKVTGTVSGLDAGTFKLGTLTVTTGGAIILPAGAALANGQVVKALAPATALSGSTLAASLVRVRQLPPNGNMALVSGAISALDTTAHTFLVGTQKVGYAGASIEPAGTTLANGQYVKVSGTLGTDGTLAAAQIVVRDSRDREVEVELHGNITQFDAASRSFDVRGVQVDASGVTPMSCPATGLANGLFVEVEGRLSSTGMIASSVTCEDEPNGGIVEREGTAGSVSTSAKTFVLARQGNSTVNVTWSDRTFFRDVTPDTLSGKRVEVEGVMDNGTLAATKVSLED